MQIYQANMETCIRLNIYEGTINVIRKIRFKKENTTFSTSFRCFFLNVRINFIRNMFVSISSLWSDRTIKETVLYVYIDCNTNIP